MHVTIDPGTQTGWAIWSREHRLLACGLGDPRLHASHLTHITGLECVWIESQIIYPRSPGPPNDIVALAQDAGRWAGRYDAIGVAVNWVLPAAWKGQEHKKDTERRVSRRLESRSLEYEILRESVGRVPMSRQNNVYDAVGIGLWVSDQ